MSDFSAEPTGPDEFLESIKRLSRDLRNAAITLSNREARFLVDAYYAMQRDRIRAAHQNRTLDENNEPHTILLWLESQRYTLERQIAGALDSYSASLQVGRWARSQIGIGPIISAGLAANINIHKCPTAGHVWRFAGLDPTREWVGSTKAKEIVANAMSMFPGARGRGVPDEALAAIAATINTHPQRLLALLEDKPRTRENVASAVAKRPWNGSLKRLCFLIGESFVKVSGNENAVYGIAYKVRKERETLKNERGDYADQARAALEEKNYGDDTIAKKWYERGKLPPARIHLRSHRWATKLFLSHYQHVAHEIQFHRPPPLPYIMERDPDLHTHFVAPPNWPME